MYRRTNESRTFWRQNRLMLKDNNYCIVYILHVWPAYGVPIAKLKWWIHWSIINQKLLNLIGELGDFMGIQQSYYLDLHLNLCLYQLCTFISRPYTFDYSLFYRIVFNFFIIVLWLSLFWIFFFKYLYIKNQLNQSPNCWFM